MSFRDLTALANATELDPYAGLGEAATYTPPSPPGGGPVSVLGVFGQAELVEDLGGAVVSTFAPALEIRAADISGGPLVGATVSVRGVSYEVINVRGPDEDDWVRLVLLLTSEPS